MSTETSIFEWEKKKIEKLKKFQLPNSFKAIGIAMVLAAFLSLVINAATIDQEIFRVVARYLMLLGLLFISLSKEKIEDEFISNLRMQSYSLAFIAGVVIILILPFIEFVLSSIFNTTQAPIHDIGDFQILLILLGTQVLYFYSLNNMHK